MADSLHPIKIPKKEKKRKEKKSIQHVQWCSKLSSTSIQKLNGWSSMCRVNVAFVVQSPVCLGLPLTAVGRSLLWAVQMRSVCFLLALMSSVVSAVVMQTVVTFSHLSIHGTGSAPLHSTLLYLSFLAFHYVQVLCTWYLVSIFWYILCWGSKKAQKVLTGDVKHCRPLTGGCSIMSTIL